ncbi:hypothetical protein [Skermania piniformis]|uniref:Uncharacterized protein n=1 Tax=Skermania pinensis TaxID=39122 RepID=A0ABX8S3A9_9ACTN|nr:hypothetical protein [Skermania piniformis]QXQ12323.1 hypothetical protein KV203_09930 [Skermania piniformis]
MTDRVRTFAAFWYDFVVGDDWRIAVGVLLGLLATLVVSHYSVLPAWWIIVAATAILLPTSIVRAIR